MTFTFTYVKDSKSHCKKEKKIRLLSKRNFFSLEEKPKALAVPKEVSFGISEPDLGLVV